MSTKASIATKITGLQSGQLNTAAEVRSLDTDLLNELFPTLINVISSSTTYATPTSNTDYPYSLLVSKNGGKVSVNGIVKNASGQDFSSMNIAEITDAELLVSDAQINGAPVQYKARIKNAVTGHIATLVVKDVAGVTRLRVEDGFVGASNTPYELIEPLIYNTKN